MEGKRFPEEFERIDEVKNTDKILVCDSDDMINKYASVLQLRPILSELINLLMVGKKMFENGEIFNDYQNNIAGNYAHAEGIDTTATGERSHVEGYKTRTMEAAISSHAEGEFCEASGRSCHAEGRDTRAGGTYSHAEGFNTRAYGNSAHAEGSNNDANSDYSHAEGLNTIANNPAEHAQGMYNVSHSGEASEVKTIHSIGIGDTNERRNAVEVMENGDVYIIGLGDYGGTNPETATTLQQVIGSMPSSPLSIQEEALVSLVGTGRTQEQMETAGLTAETIGHIMSGHLTAIRVLTDAGSKVFRVVLAEITSDGYTILIANGIHGTSSYMSFMFAMNGGTWDITEENGTEL